MNAAGEAALLARVTLSLLVVVVLAVLAARLARRAGVRGQGRAVQVLERVPLSREAAVAVVDVAGRGLVVGVTAHGVSVLGRLEATELAAVRSAHEQPPGPRLGGPAGRRPGRREQRNRRRTVRDGVTVTRLPDDPGSAGTAAGGQEAADQGPPPQGRQAGTGSVLDPRTWRQAVDALRDLTARRG